MGYGIHANPEEFERGYNFCVSQRATDSLALIFAKKFSDRGYVDFAEGCSHYALCVIVARCNNTRLVQWIPKHNHPTNCRLITHNPADSVCEGCRHWAQMILNNPFDYSPEQLDFANKLKRLL